MALICPRNKGTGEHHCLKLEPQAHCDVTVESLEPVHENGEDVRGLKMVHEPTYLRFFRAGCERL